MATAARSFLFVRASRVSSAARRLPNARRGERTARGLTRPSFTRQKSRAQLRSPTVCAVGLSRSSIGTTSSARPSGAALSLLSRLLRSRSPAALPIPARRSANPRRHRRRATLAQPSAHRATHAVSSVVLANPRPPSTKACTEQRIALFSTCVFLPTGALDPDCEEFERSRGRACVSCAIAPPAADALGPLLLDGATASLNVAGCVEAVTGDGSAGSCAAAFQRQTNCLHHACDDNCPRPAGDAVAEAAYKKWMADAADGACETYGAASDKACAAPDVQRAMAAGGCLDDGSSFESRATKLIALFCGQAPARDGGAPTN